MNDQPSFERLFADRMDSERGSTRLPDAFYDDFQRQARTVRQRPRWLAFIKEPPMRISSTVAVGSPTARVVAIMVATLLLAIMVAGAGIAGSRLLAAEGSIVVAADGSGDYTTIPEAVAAAQDGDTLMIRPGNYTEAVVIDKDITLMGDGPREEIVIGSSQPPEARNGQGCTTDVNGSCLFLLDQTDATVLGITFRGDYAGVAIRGGAPTIEGVLFDQPTELSGDGTPNFGVQLNIEGGSRAQIIGNEFIGEGSLWVYGPSDPLVEGNVLRGWNIDLGQPGDDTVIRDNEIIGSAGVAINQQAASAPLIENNIVTDAGTDGISIGFNGAGQDWDPIIRGNTITGSGGSAINAFPFAKPTIEDNTLVDNRFGVLLQVGDATVRGNDIQGEGLGIFVAGGGKPVIADNTIDVTGRGISLTKGSESTLTGNTVCGAEESIFVDDRSEPVIDDTNETCEAPAAG